MAKVIDTLKRFFDVAQPPSAAIEEKSSRESLDLQSGAGWQPALDAYRESSAVSVPKDPKAVIERYRSWCYVCANKNATAVASCNLRLYYVKRRRGAKVLFQARSVEPARAKWLASSPAHAKRMSAGCETVEILEHPFLDLMREVNDGWNYFDATELTQTFMELIGSGYWRIVFSGKLPVAFHVLPSHHVHPQYLKDGTITHFELGYGPDAQRFTPEEIVWFRQPSPLHQINTYGPGMAAHGATGIQTTVERYTDSTFRNNAMPPGMMVPEEPLTAEQADRLRDEWNARYRGIMQAGKIGLAPFKVSLQTLAVNPGLLARLADRNISREEIAACFGVPMSKLENKADASGIQGDITYYRDTIVPRTRRLEGKLNEELIPLYDDGLFVAYDNPVPPDREFDLRRAQAMVQVDGIFEVNEIRTAMGAQPDPARDGELYVRAQPQGIAMPGIDPNLARHAEPAHMKAAVDRALQRTLRKLFEEQRAAVLAALPQDRSARKNAADSFDLAEWVRRFEEATKEHLERDLLKGAAAGAQRIGMDIAFDIALPEVQEFIRDYVYRFSTSVNETTQEQLREIFQAGLSEGQSYAELADAVHGVFDNATRARAYLIAQTEGARALNAGQNEAWKRSGVVVGVRWDADQDACEFCEALAAKFSGLPPVQIGAAFSRVGDMIEGSQGGIMRITYGDVPHPPLHPRCKCSLIPILDTDEESR